MTSESSKVGGMAYILAKIIEVRSRAKIGSQES